jgi:hypothetical protein
MRTRAFIAFIGLMLLTGCVPLADTSAANNTLHATIRNLLQQRTSLQQKVKDADAAASGMSPALYDAPVSLWKTYESLTYNRATTKSSGYTVKYPRDFELTTNQNNDISGNEHMGNVLFEIRSPQDLFQTPKTNLGGLVVTVSSSATKSDVANCLLKIDDPAAQPGTPVMVNDISFVPFTTNGAGAGNFYDVRAYHTVQNSICYEIALTLHTTNIANYDPGTVTEFDMTLGWSILEKIFNAFLFTTRS